MLMLGWLYLSLTAADAVSAAPFGTLPDGRPVTLYTLTNAGATAKICDWGGIICALLVPDRHGRLGDVVLGFDDFESYRQRSPFFGCITGRYANRIAGGNFELDGRTYTIRRRGGGHALHGGVEGFDKKLWRAEPAVTPAGPRLTLTYHSLDGEEGFPGNLEVTVTYTLTADPALRIDYRAVTDRPTVVNLTNHSYFNLAGAADPASAATIKDHRLQLFAEAMTAVNDELIPTGELLPVAGTPYDFRQPLPLGQRFDQLTGRPVGYDHNYVLSGGAEPALAARVSEPTSGRIMECWTTEPGVQLYTGNFLQGLPGKGGKVYPQHGGFCLETQHYPDSPNHPNFPSTVLRPGEVFTSTTIYRFGVEK